MHYCSITLFQASFYVLSWHHSIVLISTIHYLSDPRCSKGSPTSLYQVHESQNLSFKLNGDKRGHTPPTWETILTDQKQSEKHHTMSLQLGTDTYSILRKIQENSAFEIFLQKSTTCFENKIKSC